MQQCKNYGWEMRLMQNLFQEVIMKPKMDKTPVVSRKMVFQASLQETTHWE